MDSNGTTHPSHRDAITRVERPARRPRSPLSGAVTGAGLLLLAGAAIALATFLSSYRRPGGPLIEALFPEVSRLVDREIASGGGTPRTFEPQNGGELRAALGEARPGDTIVLRAGAIYEGPFRLAPKTGTGWITLETSSADSLPPPGTGVTPRDAALMPRLVSGSDPILTALPGAHHYRFLGLEIAPAPGSFLYALVQLGDGESSLAQVPHHFSFDRCYLHGDPGRGSCRGIAMNSSDTVVVDSHLSDFKEVGADSQAICGWSGPGPFRIEGCTLEAAGENVMFGGADPAIPGLIPSDITIRRNRFSKPHSWRSEDPSFAGTRWSVKNLFELKNARRVVVDGNVFENNWAQAQSGFAILMTVRNQDRGAPWSTIEDVTFTNNVVRHAGAGIYILGHDD